MIIDFAGVEYDYDENNIDVRTGIAITQHTGKGMMSWTKGIDDCDPVCLQALLYAMKVQNGERPVMRNLDFHPLELWNVVIAAYNKKNTDRIMAAAEELMTEADPTVTAKL